MRNIVLIICLAAVLCTCHSSITRSKKIQYLLIIDDPGSDIVNEFTERFKLENPISLRDEQPENIVKVSFSVYIPLPVTKCITVSFSKSLSDKNIRYRATDTFLDSLRRYSGQSGGQRYILEAIRTLLSDITDSATDYRMLFISDMIENSAGPNTRSIQKEDWEDGKFHFSDPQGNCIPASLDEANRQLTDTTSWIYENLISNGQINSMLKNPHIYFQNSGFNLHKTMNGCSGKDVRSFWEKLFKKTGISYEKLNMSFKEFLSFEKEDPD